MSQATRGQMRQLRLERGFHIARSDVQRTYMTHQCEQLVRGWEDGVKATCEHAPARARDFKLQRQNGGMPARRSPEARWERALWNIWGPDITPPADAFVPEFCSRIQTYQMPLREHNNPEINYGWGEVDLVGYDTTHRPVLIELKEPASNDAPCAAVMQLTAYGIAFRKAWENGLHKEWQEAVGGCEDLRTLRLMLAAPQPYWDNWSDELGRCHQGLSEIVGLMGGLNFEVRFVTLGCGGEQRTPGTGN